MENYLVPGNKNVYAGIFNNKNSAEKAYYELKTHGYSPEEINVLMSKETQMQYYSDSSDNDFKPGGITDDVSSFGTNLKIPWPGLVVSGPLEANFNIRNANDSFAIIEAVTKAGIPKDEMIRYVEGLKDGKIVITALAHRGHKNRGLSQNRNDYFLKASI